tara:strand:+ start:138 stop:1598 length:1461 start_codon:yes stop_codon:yes gene_type:complete
MEIMRFIIVLLFSTALLAQEVVPRYWNSLSTHVTVGVPLVDDESLIGGRIQVRINFDEGDSFNDLGEKHIIDKDDIDDIKQVSIPAEFFESMIGFKENAKVQFIVQLWDRAGNSVVGPVSDSVMTIDQIIPELVKLEITSSNELDSKRAMEGDSITFQVSANEAINAPIFNISGESYDGAVGVDKSWMLVYPSDEADDGIIEFGMTYTDLAGNPGAPVTVASDGMPIIKDGTVPELDEISLFTSNPYDSSLAIKDDTVFINFNSSEPIRDIKILLNSNEAILKEEDSLSFTFCHIFTESDSEGVIPILLDYRDLAGNIGETIDETSDDSEVTLDMNPPADFTIEMVGSLQGELIEKEDEELEGGNKKSKKKKNEIGLIPIIVFVYIGLTFLVVLISWFKIFSKSGQAGWKALVPFLNLFVFTKIVQKPVWWVFIYLIIPIGYVLSSFQIAKLFGKNLIFSIGLLLLPIVFFPLLALGKSEYQNKSS